MVSVLFVCLGNICRSPAAEGVFTHLAREAGLLESGLRIDSAGTGSWHVGDPPDDRMQAAARRRGIDLSSLRARQVRADDFAQFDYILGMDRQNLANLGRVAPAGLAGKPRLLTDFHPDLAGREVGDPYYGGQAGFDACLDLIQDASAALLAHIRDAHFR